MSAVEWEPISALSFFSGTFNGNSHNISGITITNGNYINVAFVGCTAYASFTNFYLTDIDFDFSSSVANYVGGFCGKSDFTNYNSILIQGEIDVNSTYSMIYLSGVIGSQYNGSIFNMVAIENITLNAVNAYLYGLASSNVNCGLFYGNITLTGTGYLYVYGTMNGVYQYNMFNGNISVISTSTNATYVRAYALGNQVYSPGNFAIGTIVAMYNSNIPSTYAGAYYTLSASYVEYNLNVNGSDMISSGLTDLNVLKDKSTFMSLFNFTINVYNNYYALLSDGWCCEYLPEGYDLPMPRFCCQRVDYTITVTNNYTLADTVTGDETTYHMGDICTLIASTDVDKRFTFTKWVINGETVSTNPTYSFTVEGNTVVMAVYRYYLSTFTINHIATLFWISEQVNFGYDFDGIQIELAKDLDFSYITDQVWNTIGDSSHDFKGTFNCGGYSITYDASINATQSGGTAVQGSNITLFYSGITGKATNFVLVGNISLGVTDSGDYYDELSNLESGEPIVWEDRIISKPR